MRKFAWFSPVLAAVLAVPASLTLVSNDAYALEELIVTARQREEALSDVPASITAFREQEIERIGVQRAEDFISLTPGVTLTNTAEVGDTQLNIRGINGARDGETNFGFIIDGVLYTNPSAFNREFSDLAQIEVLKGPQGALYGRSAAAGAVIVTTKKPTNELDAEVEATFAENSTYTVQGSVAGPLVEDKLYGRLSADFRQSDGFYENIFLNDDVVDDFESYGISGRLIWEPTDQTTIDTKLRYAEVDAASITFNASFALPGFVGFLGPDAFEDANDHNFVFSNGVDPQNEQETTEFSIKLDNEQDWGTFTAWALYSDTEQFFTADGTSGAFGFYFNDPACLSTTAALAGFPVQTPAFIGPDPASSLYPPYSPTTCDGYQYQERNQEDLSVQLQITSPGDQRLRWQAGVYFLDLERTVGVAQLFDDGTNTIINSFVNQFTDALVLDTFDTQVFAVFGNVNYDLTDDVELSLALRWDQEDRDVTNGVPTPSQLTSTRIDYCASLPSGGCFLNGMPLVGTPLNPAFITDFTTGEVQDSIAGRSKTFDQLQPKLAVTWDATDALTVFGSWGIGFKSGGFNNIGGTETIQFFLVDNGANLVAPPEIFNEETTSAFEFGFKSTLADGRVDLNGAVFYTDVDDYQFFEFFVGPFGLLRVVENIDEVQLQGIELSAAAEVTDGFSVIAGVSFIDSEIDKNRIRSFTEGNDAPGVSDFTANFAAEYVAPLPFGEDLNFVGRFEYSYTGDTYYHVVQDDIVPATLFGGPDADFTKSQVEAYGLANVRVGIEGEQWRFIIFANNAFDEEWLAEVITAPEFGGSFIHPGTEREIGAEVGFKF